MMIIWLDLLVATFVNYYVISYLYRKYFYILLYILLHDKLIIAILTKL